MKIEKTARPRMRPPLPFFEGEGGEQLVGQLGPGDDRQAEPRRQEDQHVDVAQGAAAQHRKGEDRHSGDQAGGAQRGQL